MITKDDTIEIEELDGDYAEGDYGFILHPDGSLKSVMLPELLMEDPPEEIQLILKIYGISSIYDLVDTTVH